MSVRLPSKAGEIVNGDLAAWVLVARAAEATEGCICDRSCSLAELLSDPKGPISLTEIKGCPALRDDEFNPEELVECYCLFSAIRTTKPSLKSIMDAEDRELAKTTSFRERAFVMGKAGRAYERRQQKMLNLYSSLLEASLNS